MGFFVSALIGMIGLAISAIASNNQSSAQESATNQQMAIAQQQLQQNQQIANQNFGLQQNQFEYQQQLNKLQMQREDTAMQRQVADLKAAGLSPLMASGGATTGQLISGSAPQFDVSGINSALSNMLGVKQDYASRKQQAYQFQRQQQLQTAQLGQDLVSSYLDNKYKLSMITGQDITNAYNAIHGTRDPNLQSALVDLIQSYLDNKNIKPTDLIDTAIDNGKKGLTNAGETMKTNAKRTGDIILDTLETSGKAIAKPYLHGYERFKAWRMEQRKKREEKKAIKRFNKAASGWN